MQFSFETLFAVFIEDILMHFSHQSDILKVVSLLHHTCQKDIKKPLSQMGLRTFQEERIQRIIAEFTVRILVAY